MIDQGAIDEYAAQFGTSAPAMRRFADRALDAIEIYAKNEDHRVELEADVAKALESLRTCAEGARRAEALCDRLADALRYCANEDNDTRSSLRWASEALAEYDASRGA